MVSAEPQTRLVAPGPRIGIAVARPLDGAGHGIPATPPSPAPGAEPPPAAPVAVPVATPVAVEPAPVVAPEPGGQTGHSGGGPVSSGVDPGGFVTGPVPLDEGDELALSFPFFVLPATTFSAPGTDNLILRIEAVAGGPPSFGLQLWDGGTGDRGLWASGDATGGDQFLAEVVEGVWHEVAVYFRASGEGDGFYLVFLDGEPVDARSGVSLLAAGGGCGLAEAGLYRDGERVVGATDVLVGPVRVGDALAPVAP